jgi:hypothetical protein
MRQSLTSEVYALAQHVRTASLLRDQYLSLAASSDSGLVPVRSMFVGDAGENIEPRWLLLRLWYAAVFVSIEGWEKLELSDGFVDAGIKDLHTRREYVALKRFRNAVFHLQDDPYSEKLTEVLFVGAASGMLERIERIHSAMEFFFKRWRDKTDLSGAGSWPIP